MIVAGGYAGRGGQADRQVSGLANIAYFSIRRRTAGPGAAVIAHLARRPGTFIIGAPFSPARFRRSG